MVHDLTGYRPANAFVLNGVLTFGFLGMVFHLGRVLAGRMAGWLGVVLFAGLPLLGQNSTGGGFEGVTYDPENHKFYVVKERQTAAPTSNGMAVYEVLMSGLARQIFSAPVKLAGLATDLADVFYDQHSRHLFLLSQESESIIETDLTGTVFRTSAVPVPMTQPEGLTFSVDRSTLWVVGEPNEMRRFTVF